MGGHPDGPQPAPHRGGAAAIQRIKQIATSKRNSASLRINSSGPASRLLRTGRMGTGLCRKRACWPFAETGASHTARTAASRSRASGRNLSISPAPGKGQVSRPGRDAQLTSEKLQLQTPRKRESRNPEKRKPEKNNYRATLLRPGSFSCSVFRFSGFCDFFVSKVALSLLDTIAPQRAPPVPRR